MPRRSALPCLGCERTLPAAAYPPDGLMHAGKIVGEELAELILDTPPGAWCYACIEAVLLPALIEDLRKNVATYAAVWPLAEAASRAADTDADTLD